MIQKLNCVSASSKEHTHYVIPYMKNNKKVKHFREILLLFMISGFQRLTKGQTKKHKEKLRVYCVTAVIEFVVAILILLLIHKVFFDEK